VSVLAEIQDEIRAKGPITFARFMELALYSSEGYYEQQERIGKAGDFYTSVSVGSVFGQLLARQFATWLNETGTNEIVEAGAHDATLARDILGWIAEKQPQLSRRLRYIIVEPSTRRREWQEQTLQAHKERVCWQNCLPSRIRGVVFGNELLDAMPVNRLHWNAQRRNWGEWFVKNDGAGLTSVKGDLSPALTDCVPIVASELSHVLPDGFTTEISPAAIHWWNESSRAVERGRLVGIDYGLTDEEFFRPDRKDGTVRSYVKHRLTDAVLSNPGEQDITAHVNWSAIQRAGESAGLQTEMFCSQEQFLMRIIKEAPTENWTAEQIKQLKTLTHPNFLGRAFRVLVQRRV
jgi:SAM-dependent MidA family methyltransferase